MRKSNYIIYIIAIIISAFLLWLWYWLGLDHVDAPLDLVLSIIWWILIALACFIIHKVEKKRQERARTCYLAAHRLYNSEAGVKAFSGPVQAVEVMKELLDELEYNFHVSDLPEDEEFRAVVRSKKFEIKKQKDDEIADAAAAVAPLAGPEAIAAAHAAQVAAAANGTEKIVWEGEVADPRYPDDDPIPFETEDQLLTALEKLLPAY